MITIELATEKDLEHIQTLFQQGKAFLKSQGIDQWQNDYPSKDDAAKDVATHKGWCLIKDSKIVGYACLDADGEPSYDTLKGKWLDNLPYLVVHRMVIDDTYKHQGLARTFFAEIDKYAISNNIFSIRIDTDDANMIMKQLIKASGYTYCGTIWFDNSIKIAFQKQLHDKH